MQLPFFFEASIPETGKFVLSEESSKHIIQVLRMQSGEQVIVTNGKGKVLTASITLENKRNTEVEIIKSTSVPRQNQKVSIAVSLIKNSNRFEWFLEKATELGVSEIIPLICKKTEKHQRKWDRMQNILISAMLQSRQAWLPELKEPTIFFDLIKKSNYQQRFIAHCKNGGKKTFNEFTKTESSSIILIGPEGDFTEDEINNAIENNYIPVSLGETRLRTETAGVVAAVLLLNK